MSQHQPLLPLPYGMFRYLYYHFQVRYPQPIMQTVARAGFLETVESVNERNLPTHLVENSWLIGAARPDLADAVEALWSEMTPLARGDYLAGQSEWANSEGRGEQMPIESLLERFDAEEPIELSPETACQLGCNMISLDCGEAFLKLLDLDIDWSQEIDRATEGASKRWKPIGLLSRRVIDVFLEAALVCHREGIVASLLEKRASPNIIVWQQERSYSALYTALSFAIKEDLSNATGLLLDHGADASGSVHTDRNSPLSEACQNRDLQLIKRLVASGASFEDGTRYDEAPSLYEWHRPVEWVSENLSELMDFVPVESKPLFHWPNAQCGMYYSLLECFFNHPEDLPELEELGLDTNLTINEMAILIKEDGYEVFSDLMGRLGDEVREEAISRVQKEWPDFGARRRFFDTLPQHDRRNAVTDFKPDRSFQIELSDGSVLHPYLEAIASPDHELGECLPNFCWVESVECELRRPGDQVVVESVTRKWERRELPPYAKKSETFLPVIREFDGEFTWVGVTLGQVQWNLRHPEHEEDVDRFFDSANLELLEEETVRRIKLQQAANEKPREPVLSRDELEGYPNEYWPYLIRLDNGLIGMTEESCCSDERHASYLAWARENKKELDFVPDPRCTSWMHWESVPPELKPFIEWDNLFGRPGFTYSSNNDYEKAMLIKATRWWNGFFVGGFLEHLENQKENPDKS